MPWRTDTNTRESCSSQRKFYLFCIDGSSPWVGTDTQRSKNANFGYLVHLAMALLV